MSPKWMAIGIGVGIALAGCGGTKVITAEEMQAADRAAQQSQQTQQPREEGWQGAWLDTGSEVEILSPNMLMIRGTKTQISLVTTGWSTHETPRGETRFGWAEFQLVRGSEAKRVRIEEDATGYALGFQLDVTYAYEQWNEKRADYDAHAKLVITPPSP